MDQGKYTHMYIYAILHINMQILMFTHTYILACLHTRYIYKSRCVNLCLHIHTEEYNGTILTTQTYISKGFIM